MLRYFPGLLAGVFLGAVLLAGSLALAPVALSATASDSLRSSITLANVYTSGFFMAREGLLDAGHGQPAGTDLYKTQNAALQHTAADIPHLQPLIFTQISPGLDVSHEGKSTIARLSSRTDAKPNVTLLEGSRSGFLVPDAVAKALHLVVGDNVTIRSEQGTSRNISLRVGGIYRDLVHQPNRAFWSNLAQDIQQPDPTTPAPPPLIIGARGAIVALFHRLHLSTLDERWEFPLEADPSLTLDQARRTSAALTALRNRLRPNDHLGRLFYCGRCAYLGTNRVTTQGLAAQIDSIDYRLTAITPPVQSISGAGALVALAVLTSAGIYGGTRRRPETVLLVARGWTEVAIASRSAFEDLLPLAAGTAAGFFSARAIGAAAGPHAPVDPSAVSDALLRVAISFPLAALSLLLVALFTARSIARPRHEGDLGHRRVLPWEALVAGAAIVAYIASGHGSISFQGQRAPLGAFLLLGFPLLVLVAASGIIARLLRRGLSGVMGWAERLRPAQFLAISRLRVSTSIAMALLVATATSLGLFVYAQAMVDSLTATAFAKASVFVGGDASVLADPFYKPPKQFKLPSSSLFHVTSITTVSGGPVDVLAIDPRTFARAALWSEHFSSTPLPDLMKALGSKSMARLPFIAVASEQVAKARHIDQQGTPIKVRAVGTASAFPGTYGDTPWMVVDARRFLAAIRKANGPNPAATSPLGEMIVRGPPGRVVPQLEALGYRAGDILTTQRVLDQPTLVAAVGTLRVLRVLGIAAGLLSVLALLLYLQVRQRKRSLANALSARMGLGEGQHLVAVALELGAILIAATIIALGGGFAVAILTHSWVDPFVGVPPLPLLVLPAVLIPLMLVGAAVLVLAGAGVAQWSSHRVVLAEEMRRVG